MMLKLSTSTTLTFTLQLSVTFLVKVHYYKAAVCKARQVSQRYRGTADLLKEKMPLLSAIIT
jgi:hypothetical protein